MVNETAVHFVMVSWIAQLTVSQEGKVVQRSVSLVKEAGQPYDFFGLADWPTLHNLCSCFALNHIVDN